MVNYREKIREHLDDIVQSLLNDINALIEGEADRDTDTLEYLFSLKEKLEKVKTVEDLLEIYDEEEIVNKFWLILEDW